MLDTYWKLPSYTLSRFLEVVRAGPWEKCLSIIERTPDWLHDHLGSSAASLQPPLLEVLLKLDDPQLAAIFADDFHRWLEKMEVMGVDVINLIEAISLTTPALFRKALAEAAVYIRNLLRKLSQTC